jgi:rhamnosyltransferase subunit B
VSRRIVLNCWGSFGDLFPYLALAIALNRRGHRAVLATSGFYRDLVEQAGVEFHPVPPDIDPTDTPLMARVMDAARGSEVIVREMIAPHVRDAFAALRAAVEGADVLVTHPVAFAGPLVGRATGVPWLSGVLAPTSMGSAHDLPLFPPLPQVVRLMRASPSTARAFLWLVDVATRRWTESVRALAQELGLPDAGNPLFAGQFSPHGTLALFSPVLGAPQPDWPVRTVATGFVFHDQAQTLDPDLQRFIDAGQPPVVFTLGTSAAGAPGLFYEESAKAVERLGVRAIMLIGAFPGAHAPRQWPDSVLAWPYAPHAPLFRCASAIVHHAGVGTLAQALRAGRPMLAVPHAHDQPDNAFRASRLGVARVIPAHRYRADAVVRHLRALLDEPAYRSRAQDVGRVVDVERGTDVACDTILAACRAERA